MATKTATPVFADFSQRRPTQLAYTEVSAGDTLTPIDLERPAAFASIQVEGLVGSSVALLGSNDGVNPYPIKDKADAAIVLSGDGIAEFSTAVAFLHLNCTGGAESEAITITVVTWE